MRFYALSGYQMCPLLAPCRESYINSVQFSIIGLLIRPFPEKIDTKSLLSLLVIVLVIVIIHKK